MLYRHTHKKAAYVKESHGERFVVFFASLFCSSNAFEPFKSSTTKGRPAKQKQEEYTI